jgi:hypothetical protein
MKKIIIAIGLVALIVIGSVIYVGTQLDSIVAGLIENEGSAATQTPVRVAGVEIKISEASAAISNLTVGNPAGFSGNAIEMEGFSVSLDPSSLTTDTIVIKDVTVSGARLNVLQQGVSNNLNELLDNLRSLQQGDSETDGAGKKLIIDRFTLEGASAFLSAPDLAEDREVSLPTIVVRDIGRSSNGATGAQVAQQILRPVIDKTLSSAATQSLKDKASEKLEEVKDSLLKGLSGALGGDDEPEN